MAKDLLFELGIEEIPARFMAPALKQLSELTAAKLAELSLEYTGIKTYGTPRRFTLIVEGLAEMQPDVTVEAKGPAKKAAYDENGEPTRALQGFCKSQGVEPADLIEKELKGVAYLYANKSVKGRAAAEILPDMLAEIVHKLYFPKPMRWAYGDMRFARPIRWIVLLFGADVLPLTLGGVEAGNISRGHRFLGSQEIVLTGAAEYEATLEKECVIVDPDKRRELIWAQVQAVAEAAGGMVKPDPELLEEVVYILEYPTALLGNFEEKYLDMPVELVVTPMREHQRYFPVYAKDGSLMNHFIAVRNGNSEHLDIVQAGNEKVLRARLADAVFFWQEDCKKPLEDNFPRLEAIVFHEKLGTLAAKVNRIAALADSIGHKLGYNETELAETARAAKLMKCDLVSNAVFEFTELQGTMGKYYAQVHNEAPNVALAIEEHYLPRFAGDALPTTKAGVALAMADRLDSLVGFFSQKMLPTGSQDPYALRRAANGICQIVLNHELDLSLTELISEAYKLYANVHLESNADDCLADLQNFFKQRLDTVLADAGIGYDVAAAVLAKPTDNIKETYAKAQAIAAFKEEAGYAELMAGYNRANNILAKAEHGMAVDEALFTEDAEKALYEAVFMAKGAAAAALEYADYAGVLHQVGLLRPQIDAFFNDVMVMADDAAVRANRLAVLAHLVELANEVGVLSKLNA